MVDSQTYSAPLRVFWWKAVPNFGDALSAVVTAHVSGRVVEHANPGKCELFAIGSVLKVARRKLKTARRDGVKPWIWGSGLMAPVSPEFLDHAQVALLRGPVTAALLGLEMDQFGDPGLLAVDAVGPAPERHDRIGIVPHHRHVDDPDLVELIASDPALELIDVRADVTRVCHQIASCRHVFASSLHGLIVADSYGVPNTWMDPISQSRLKYLDYAASVGRDMSVPVQLEDIPARLKTLTDTPLPYRDGIARARQSLLSSFPDALRAVPTKAVA